jgi:thymidylate kinase
MLPDKDEFPVLTVALDGIDGAGKTTVSECLEARLSKTAGSVVRYTHRCVSHPEPIVEERIRLLRKLIWGRAKSNHEVVNSYHRFLLVSAWYHLVARCLAQQSHRQRARVLILDGWWYRHVAKTALRTGMTVESLGRLFEHITLKPQRRFLLVVAPEVAWTRKSYDEHEFGYWDGLQDLAPPDAFRQYQGKVHSVLTEVEDTAPWTLVPVQGSDRAVVVVEKILDLIHHDLSSQDGI